MQTEKLGEGGCEGETRNFGEANREMEGKKGKFWGEITIFVGKSELFSVFSPLKLNFHHFFSLFPSNPI